MENSFAGYFPVIKSFLLFFVCGREGGGKVGTFRAIRWQLL